MYLYVWNKMGNYYNMLNVQFHYSQNVKLRNAIFQ